MHEEPQVLPRKPGHLYAEAWRVRQSLQSEDGDFAWTDPAIPDAPLLRPAWSVFPAGSSADFLADAWAGFPPDLPDCGVPSGFLYFHLFLY